MTKSDVKFLAIWTFSVAGVFFGLVGYYLHPVFYVLSVVCLGWSLVFITK